ncbi:glutathione S-transferase family protein [Rhizobiaceae bacterium]|nr:glutathione S-transferase family protein [Rhizobiaceae bacterium]
MSLLYQAPLSAASRMVRLVLGEYDLTPPQAEERVWERRPEFLEVNPAGTLPVLVDDGAIIVGAQTIGEYLDETRGALSRDRRLFPDTPAERAEMRRMVDWALVKLEGEVVRYAVHERITKRQMTVEQGGGPPDSQALRAARSNIRYHLAYFAWLLSKKDWIAGPKMTQADLAVAGSLSVLDYMGEIQWAEAEEGGFMALRDWYARMKSRPSFRPLLADRLRGLPPVSHYADLDF